MDIATNRISELRREGQSVWLDNIRRQLITSGGLAGLRDLGVSGVTSNPTIFEKAVTGSAEYDEPLVQFAREGRSSAQALWELIVQDIQMAADVFRPVYDRTAHLDGYVSIEVSPAVAGDTRRTIEMAEDLRHRCDRPNVMVKIPATEPGIPAIRDQIGKGHNINVTLIFSVERYKEVVEAFLSGLEDLQRAGGDLSQVASVASFFVSRVDTKVDRLLEAKTAEADLKELLGKAGIANSKTAYRLFRELHSGKRWERLSQAGARVQRCLWASTSVKNPRYPDTMYVDGLIGPDTVNTLPDHTLQAFLDHGRVARTLDREVDHARQQLEELSRQGVDLNEVTRELEVEGVTAFERSYESLEATLQEAMAGLAAGAGKSRVGGKGG